MNDQATNTTAAGGSPLERPVGRPEPERADAAPRCCYCCKPAPGWTAAEAASGKRWESGALRYHCYTAYCWD